MTLTLTVCAAAIAAAHGPWLRSRIFAHSAPYGRALRRRCPRCRTPLATRWRTQLPITGRCPLCHKRIGPATGTVELLAATIAAAITWHSTNPLTLAALLWITWHGIVLSFVDTTVRRLPDRLTLQAFTGTALLLTAAAAITGSWRQLGFAFLGAVALGAFYMIIVLAKPGSLGLGDAKLAPTVGLILAWFHPTAVITGLITTVVIGASTGAILVMTRRGQRHQAYAHGPILLTGALAAFLRAV